MGHPTSISVSVDDTEYSRYEDDHKTITATVVVSGGAPYTTEEVVVSLRKARRNRDAIVATQTLSLAAATDPDTQVVEFNLPDIIDSDLINLVRHGKYFVHAEYVATEVEGESDDFDVRIVTIDKLKRDFLFGLDLRATELKQLRYQPVSITGIRITDVSKGQPEGFGTLSYHYHVDGATTIRTLAWNGGPSVSIPSAGTYLLQSGSTAPVALPLPIPMANPAYIEVRVQSVALLPTSSVTESVLIERTKMDDKALAGFLENATKWLEEDELAVYVEPTNVVSEVDPTTIQYSTGIADPTPITTDADYDFVKSPLTYFIPSGGYPGWVWIQTPFLSILRVDSLYGAIAGTRVIDVDLEWIEHSTEGGFIQLVPFNTEVAFDFLGLMWVNSIHGATELPNFWRYNMIVGLREASADIRNIIAKKAAIDALTLAGQAIRPGVGSLSLGRDGVSQSVSFTAQQQYGMFNAAIQRYNDEIKDTMPKLRARYRGATLVVV